MKKFAVAAVMMFVLSMVAVASAQWVADGSGTGRAQAGSLSGLSITPGMPVGLLFPGGSGDVAATITNTNDQAVEVTAIIGNGAVTSDDVACESVGHGVTFTDQAGTWIVPANGSLDVNLVDAVQMAADAPNECQGVTFSVPLGSR